MDFITVALSFFLIYFGIGVCVYFYDIRVEKYFCYLRDNADSYAEIMKEYQDILDDLDTTRTDFEMVLESRSSARIEIFFDTLFFWIFDLAYYLKNLRNIK